MRKQRQGGSEFQIVRRSENFSRLLLNRPSNGKNKPRAHTPLMRGPKTGWFKYASAFFSSEEMAYFRASELLPNPAI